jgi:hypothetical protein
LRFPSNDTHHPEQVQSRCIPDLTRKLLHDWQKLSSAQSWQSLQVGEENPPMPKMRSKGVESFRNRTADLSRKNFRWFL